MCSIDYITIFSKFKYSNNRFYAQTYASNTRIMKTKFLSIILILTSSVILQAQTIWKGNDYLNNTDWRQNGWGLVAWNNNMQIVTNGFWGYEDVDVVADPYDPSHDVVRIRFETDGVTTESGAGLLFAPDLSFLSDPKMACLSYNILLDNDFEWGTVGGKFPGLYGLDPTMGIPTAETCTGPFPIESNRCFSNRISWRGLPNQGFDTTQMFYELISWMDEDTCRPTWNCNLPYGAGLVMENDDSKAFEAIHGEWVNIKNEVKLNDEGMSNGYMRIWYNDVLVYDEQGLSIVTSQSVNIYGILFHALFGQGFNLGQGSPITQYCYLSDFEIGDSFDAINSATGLDNAVSNQANVRVYPNPTKGLVNIDLGSINSEAVINVFNTIGGLVSTTKITQKQYLNYQLPETSGFYIIQVLLANGSSSYTRVIKEYKTTTHNTN